MPTAIETAAAAYFAHAEPTFFLGRSRPAQRHVRLVDDQFANDPTFGNAHETLFDDSGTYFFGDKTQSGFVVFDDVAETVAVPSAIAPEKTTRADDAIFQLLRLEQLEDNWDGSGAAKPLRYSLEAARQFIRALSPESEIPRSALHADGHAILFLRDKNKYAELEFVGDSKISFYARLGGEEWGDDFIFDGSSLPLALTEIGFAI